MLYVLRSAKRTTYVETASVRLRLNIRNQAFPQTVMRLAIEAVHKTATSDREFSENRISESNSLPGDANELRRALFQFVDRSKLNLVL